MQFLSTADILQVWERCLNQVPVERTLTILAVANPEMSRQDIAKLSIGDRDARLLKLREWLFGNQIISSSYCPECKQLMEWDSNIADLQLQPLSHNTAQQNHIVSQQDYVVEFRLPNTLDLIAVSGTKNVSTAQQQLLKFCVSKIEQKNKPVTVEQLPDRIIQQIIKQMEQSDPQADVNIELLCASCGFRWEAIFDIASFLWAEINAWAKQMLRVVHTLARVYGWSEHDIMKMSPIRRQLYLEMVSV